MVVDKDGSSDTCDLWTVDGGNSDIIVVVVQFSDGRTLQNCRNVLVADFTKDRCSTSSPSHLPILDWGNIINEQLSKKQ